MERFRQWRDDLRARHDDALHGGSLPAFQAELQEQASLPASASSAGRADLLGRRMATWTVGRLEREFAELKVDAATSGDAEPLKLLVVATFEEESRALLEAVWMDCLSAYPRCDADVFGAVQRRVHSEFQRAVSVRRVGLVEMVRAQVLMAVGCPGLGDDARQLLFSLLALGSQEERDGLWGDIQTVVAYSPELGRQMLQAIRDDPAQAFGVTEALRRYASRGQLDLAELLSAAPDLALRLLDEGFAGRNATAAFCEAIAQFGGAWAADLLRTTLQDESVPITSKALMLSMFGDAPDVHWTEFTELSSREDDSGELARAAAAALGMRATHDPDALRWLESEARATGARHRVLAIEALAATEAAGVAPFLLKEVLPTARGAARVSVVQAYARQPTADAAVLASMTDAGREQDPEVRSAAAWSHLAVGRDIAATGALLERMVADPDEDVRRFATVARGLLLEAHGERQALSDWELRHDSLSARLARGAAENWMDSSWLAGDPELALGLQSALQDSRGAASRDQQVFLMTLYHRLKGSRTVDSQDERNH